MKKWEVVNRETVFKCKWFEIYKDKCINDRGKVIPDYYWYKGNSFVVIVGMTTNNELVMIEQYRHGSKEYLLEFPAGNIDDGEEFVKSALRELKEETGYTTDEIIFKKEYYLEPSFTDKKGYIFLARNLKKVSDQQLEDEESINVKLIKFENLQELVESNTIKGIEHMFCAMLALQNKEWLLDK